ncbi:MAG: type II toxin-antitoxin system RelE/ParE family toxin [Eggerthellaceae bacterium]|nr:type II toxin-antitoxin system RelE/ParE family toxin [Eggerthellaceae bacterium]
MTYTVRIKKQAEKEISKLEKKTQLLIVHWIFDNLEGCKDPRMVRGAKKLEGIENGWRWRVGTYRILGRIQDDKVLIELFKVGHRKEVYRNLR